jgi:hypothetical protein
VFLLKIVEFGLERAHELGEVHSIDHAMVTAEGQMDSVMNVQPTVDDYGALFCCANGQNRYLRRVDDSNKLVDLTDDAQVADRKGASLEVIGMETVGARSFDQLAAFLGQTGE